MEEAFASFPLCPVEVKVVRGVHRKVAVYSTLQSEKVLKFKSRQAPYVHTLPGNCWSVFLVAGFPYLCLFSIFMIAARLNVHALDLLSLCSEEGAESPWLKTVGTEVCSRD